MKTEVYKTILKHLAEIYNINTSSAFSKISPINLLDRGSINATQLTVKNQVFYITNNKVYNSLEIFDNNIILACEIGYIIDKSIILYSI